MRAGSREHGLHVAMLTSRTPLHLGRPRIQRNSSSMHRAMEEDSLMTRYADDSVSKVFPETFSPLFILHVHS